MENAIYYIVALVMIIIGFVVMKKLAGCMLKAVVTTILIVFLGILYFVFFRN